MAKLIVTAAPPTSNGDLHLGHISGPYLGADVFARVRRQMGDSVLCVSYSDDFQSYVQRKAFEQTGNAGDLDARSLQVAKSFGHRMAQSLKSAGIEYDIFMHSSESENLIPALAKFFDAADQKNLLFKKDSEMPRSEMHGVWGYEAFARGTCPNCGASTDTSQCESCAFPPNIAKMEGLRFVLDNSEMELVQVNQIFLNIGAKRDFLRSQFSKMNCRPPLREFREKLLNSPLQSWAISRPGDWGPELPEHPGSSLHTWFAGISGYLAASMDWAAQIGEPEAWREYWESEDTGIIHFVGIDCAYSHGVVYPILLSCVENGPSVREIYTNQFLTLNGHGFSTSRGLAIWACDFFDDVNTDAARYYLALKSPELQEADFNLHDFETTTNHVFKNILCKAIKSVINNPITDTHFSDGLSTEIGIIKLADIRKLYLKSASVAKFSMNGLAKSLENLLTLIHLSDRAGLPQLLSLYAALSEAIQPEFSQQLNLALGVPDGWANQWLTDGVPLPPISVTTDVLTRLTTVIVPFVDSSVIQKLERQVAETIKSQLTELQPVSE